MLHAQDASAVKATSGSGQYFECVAQSADRAVCDQDRATENPTAGPVEDKSVSTTTGEQQMPAHIGRNMSAKPSSDNEETEAERVWFLYQLAP
jgi:hypothetical protein